MQATTDGANANMPAHLPSFLKAAAQLHIDVNGIFVPFKSIIPSIRRFCTPGYFHHEDSVIDLTKSGTAFKLRYRGRNLAMLTKHQLGVGLGKNTADSFAVIIEEPGGRSFGMTPNTATRITLDKAEHENLGDLLLLEYDDVRRDRDLRGLFLQNSLHATLRNIPAEAVQAIFAVGYPTFAGTIEFTYDEDWNIVGYDLEARWVGLYLISTDRALLDTENRMSMIQAPKANQEIIAEDGMSGSPVFFVYLDNEKHAHLGFAGLITDARHGRYMVYEADLIRRILDDYIDNPAG